MAIALNERNIPHEKCLVDLQNKPENFTSTYARASPARAKVPVLEVGDDVLVESMVILEYLDRESAADPIVRASERLLAAELPKSFGYISVLKEEEGSEAEATAIETLVDSLKSADALLRTHARGDGPFVGDAFGHVEEAAAPFACRLTRLLPALRPQHSIDAMLTEHKLDRLKAWLDAVTDRPSCTSTMPTKEEMVDSSKKMMARIKEMAAAAR